MLTVPAFLEPLSIVLIPAKLLRSSAVSWIPFESISDPDTAEILYGASKIDVSLEVAVTTTSSISFAVSPSLSWAIKDILKKNVIWVKGNHDNSFQYVNIKTYTSYKLKNFIFSHISNKKNKLEISAHYHPKVTFKFKGTKVSKPCFLIDKEKIILPAYGAYTGGLNISSNIYNDVFFNDYQIYALGNTKVLKIEKKF